MNRWIRSFARITAFELRLCIRSHQSLFYTFAFPLLLLIIFGGIWGRYPGYIDLLVPGLVGMVVASQGFYSVGIVINAYRAYGSWRMIRTSPLPLKVYLAAIILSRTLLVVLSLGVLLAAAAGFYHLTVRGLWPMAGFIALASLGMVVFSLLGMALVSFFRSFQGATVAANLFFFPMLFLGGSFYPVDNLPPLFRFVSAVLPLTLLNELLRSASRARIALDTQFLTLLTGLLLWGALSFVLTLNLLGREERR